MELTEAVAELTAVLRAGQPHTRIRQLQEKIRGRGHDELQQLLLEEKITDDSLSGALIIKKLSAEINVVIHAIGILLTLPRILEPGEQVLSSSLGAGSGGQLHDLETNQRIAEFKFTTWRGHDAVRQREVFADFVNLAEATDNRRRQLFVAGAALPRRFLLQSNRQLTSVCDRRPEVLSKIRLAHGESIATVAEYSRRFGVGVEIHDLAELLPAYVVRDIAAAADSPDSVDQDEE